MKKLLRWTKRISFSILFVVLIILLPILINKGYEKIRGSFLTDQEKWLEDVDRVDYLLQNEFPYLEKFVDAGAYKESVNTLRQSILEDSTFNEEKLQLEIIKLIASLKDPHTIVYNFREVLDTVFPFRVEWYDSAFYLTAGKMSDDSWLGARVVKIDGRNPLEFYHKLKAYTNGPNEASHAYFMGMFSSLPAVLYHEGLIDSREQISLTVENRTGDVQTFLFAASTQNEKSSLVDYQTLSKKYADVEKPLFKTRSAENYWFSFLDKDNTLYLRYNQCVAQGDIENFWKQLFTELDDRRPNKFVIDIRGNPGGDSQNNVTLVQEIIKRPWLNSAGKLFTITDRGTGSAAVSLTSDLEILSNTMLVGEKPVDRANTTSDPTFFTLPHSGLTLLLPNLFSLHSHIYDQRDGIEMDWAITTSYAGEGYLFDAALDSILSAQQTVTAKQAAVLPTSMEGTYSFSPLRNLSLFQKADTWMIAIDGMFETPIYEKDSVFYTDKYDMVIKRLDAFNNSIRIKLHGNEIVAMRLKDKKSSILAALSNGDIETARIGLAEIEDSGQPPFYLDRPFFQNRVYMVYHNFGFEKALEFNQLNKELHPGDPVSSIVDFELYQYNGGNLWGQTTAVFSIVGKLLNRYYSIITTDKIMNDDYNAFIGS